MGSKMLSNFISPYNSNVFEQLCEKSGSILIGKTNLVWYKSFKKVINK